MATIVHVGGMDILIAGYSGVIVDINEYIRMTGVSNVESRRDNDP
jgi:hypothetical protein